MRSAANCRATRPVRSSSARSKAVRARSRSGGRHSTLCGVAARPKRLTNDRLYIITISDNLVPGRSLFLLTSPNWRQTLRFGLPAFWVLDAARRKDEERWQTPADN